MDPCEVTDIDVLTNSSLYKQWCDMHLYWLYKYEVWEEADQISLDNPQASIFDSGGKIMGIMVGDTLAASVGVKPFGDSKLRWEIVKFAVVPEYQGRGLGGILLRSAILYCTECMRGEAMVLCSDRPAGTRLPICGVIQLDSSSKLVSAVNLYEKHGFKFVKDFVSKYVTADIFLELEIDLTTGAESSEPSLAGSGYG